MKELTDPHAIVWYENENPSSSAKYLRIMLFFLRDFLEARWARELHLRTLAVAVLLAFAGTATAEEAASLRIAHPLGYGGKESPDPISPTRFFELNELLYDRLLRQGDHGEPTPGLAVSWSGSDDARQWTFKLRQGVTFHDGTAFTAADVVYSLMRIKSEKIASPTRSVLGFIDKVEAIDDSTVKITLANPDADFPFLLMDYRARILPSRGREGKLDELNETGIGTGPFKLVKLDAAGTTVVEAFPGYWEGHPKLDRIEIIAIPSDDAQVQALLAGQIDLLGSVQYAKLPLFKGQGFVVQSVATGDWSGLVMRNDMPPFDDVRVRRALRLLVDRKAMRQLLAGAEGGTITCDHPIWSGDPYRSEIDCPADPATAKKLLAEAGYPDGLQVDLYTSDVAAPGIQMAEIYQQQAAAIGVKVNIKVVPADGYWTKVWTKVPFCFTDWSQRPADQVLNEVFRSKADWNESGFDHPFFDWLLDAARREMNLDQRKELYTLAQRMLYEEGGTMVPFTKNNFRVTAKQVSGLPPVQDFSIRWNEVAKAE